MIPQSSHYRYFFEVQNVNRQHIGHKTYTEKIESTVLYTFDDKAKAINHFKRKAANKIILHQVTYTNEMPYYKDILSWGEKLPNGKVNFPTLGMIM